MTSRYDVSVTSRDERLKSRSQRDVTLQLGCYDVIVTSCVDSV